MTIILYLCMSIIADTEPLRLNYSAKYFGWLNLTVLKCSARHLDVLD